MTEADELLADARALRRRARTDRHAYWLPLLYFGLAIAAAAPLYARQRVGAVVTDADGVSIVYPVPGLRTGSYWTAVLLSGALVVAWWYRRRGARVGLEGRVGPALVAATLAVLGYVLIGGLPVRLAPTGSWTGQYGALLVIAVGLLALAWEERSRTLGVVAGLFGGVAVWVNDNGVLAALTRLGWDPFEHPGQLRLLPVPSLLLPAAVLLAGAAVAGVQAWRSR